MQILELLWGVLDEFRLYSRALTATEVAGIHGAANVTVNATSTPSPAIVSCAGNQLTLTGKLEMHLLIHGRTVNPYPYNTAFVPTISGAYVVTATDGEDVRLLLHYRSPSMPYPM